MCFMRQLGLRGAMMAVLGLSPTLLWAQSIEVEGGASAQAEGQAEAKGLLSPEAAIAEAKARLGVSAPEEVLEALARVEAMAYFNEHQAWLTSIDLAQGLAETQANNSRFWGLLTQAYLQRSQDLGSVQALNMAAEASLSQLVTLRPEAENLKILAELRVKLDYDNALESLHRAAEALPEDAGLQRQLGMLYLNQGKHYAAIEHFEKAYALNPNDIFNRAKIIEIYFQSGNLERAAELSQALARSSGRNVFWNNATLGFYRAQRYEKALESALEGLKFQASDAQLKLYRVYSLLALKRFEEAKRLTAAEVQALNEQDVFWPFFNFAMAQALLAESCPLENLRSCAGPQPEACCKPLAEAHALLEKSRSEELLKEPRYLQYLAMSQAFLGKIEEARALLKKAMEEQNEVFQGAKEDMALLKALLEFYALEGGEQKAALDQLKAWRLADGQLRPEEQRLNRARLEGRWFWPESALALSQSFDKQGTAKGDCSCRMQSAPTAPNAALLLTLLLAGLGLIVVRRSR